MRNIGHTKTFRPEQPAEVGEEIVESGLIVQEAEQVASDQPEQVATMVNYDQQNEDDDQNDEVSDFPVRTNNAQSSEVLTGEDDTSGK